MKSKLAIVCGLLLASATALAANDDMGTSSRGGATGTTAPSGTTGNTGTGTGATGTGTTGATGSTSRSGSNTEMGTSTFMSLDKDRDGRISRQEARPSSDVSNKFEDADANGDGFLSQTEHQSLTGIN
jgi:hypothetical protein